MGEESILGDMEASWEAWEKEDSGDDSVTGGQKATNLTQALLIRVNPPWPVPVLLAAPTLHQSTTTLPQSTTTLPQSFRTLPRSIKTLPSLYPGSPTYGRGSRLQALTGLAPAAGVTQGVA